tara:strand:+ start:14414 stop:14902 length:489 start_codon:yes stop_codon:yes gene_type:complete
MKAIIFGGGKERTLVKGVPLSLFTVSCNLSYLNANVYFAQDDQIINQLIRKKVKALFLTYKMYEKYSDNPNADFFLLDEDKLWNRPQGFSTGLLAICTMNNWGFDRIYLSGFSFDKPNSNIDKLGTVLTSQEMRKLCVISESFEHDIINSITKEEFYEYTKT